MLRLRWKTTEVADFGALVGAIPAETLASPRRSVVPLVDFFRNPVSALAQLSHALERDLTDATELVFEHAVPVQRGVGKASYTDLMIRCEMVSVAIEAKYTEPRYDTVTTWLGSSPTPNRLDVLGGWLSLINTVATHPIDIESVRALPYQLIHRAASACSPRSEYQMLVYLVFGDEPGSYYVDDVAKLDALLGHPKNLSMHVLSARLTGAPDWLGLAHRWDAGERDLAQGVREQLLGGHLFRFGDLRIQYHRGVRTAV